MFKCFPLDRFSSKPLMFDTFNVGSCAYKKVFSFSLCAFIAILHLNQWVVYELWCLLHTLNNLKRLVSCAVHLWALFFDFNPEPTYCTHTEGQVWAGKNSSGKPALDLRGQMGAWCYLLITLHAHHGNCVNSQAEEAGGSADL